MKEDEKKLKSLIKYYILLQKITWFKLFFKFTFKNVMIKVFKILKKKILLQIIILKIIILKIQIIIILKKKNVQILLIKISDINYFTKSSDD